jgi:hypothetical protein
VSTENPVISNFRGLEKFQELIDQVVLEVFDADSGGWFQLERDGDKFRCHGSDIPNLGIRILAPNDEKKFSETCDTADIDPDDVIFVVRTDASFVRERHFPIKMKAKEVQGVMAVVESGGTRPRSLQDHRRGAVVEVAFLLDRDLLPKPGRPFRRGTRLSSKSFFIRPLPDAHGIDPLPLTEEVIGEHNLPPKTVLFVDFHGSLLDNTPFSEVIQVYADAKLLEELTIRRKGPAYDFIGTQLAVEACQQIVSAAATEILMTPNFIWEATESRPVLEFILSSVNTTIDKKAKEHDRISIVNLLRDKPNVVAAYMTTLGSMLNRARKLIGEEGGN